MTPILDAITSSLTTMGLHFTVHPAQQTVELGIELDSGRRFQVALCSNNEAHDVTIYTAVAPVSAHARSRVARQLSEDLNNRFKGITFSFVEGLLIVGHLIDLEWVSAPEALIRKGLLRVVCVLEEVEALFPDRQPARRTRRNPTVVREVERILTDLSFP